MGSGTAEATGSPAELPTEEGRVLSVSPPLRVCFCTECWLCIPSSVLVTA